MSRKKCGNTQKKNKIARVSKPTPNYKRLANQHTNTTLSLINPDLLKPLQEITMFPSDTKQTSKAKNNASLSDIDQLMDDFSALET